MPKSKFKREKLFYSITEVAEMFQLNPSQLRFWEKEFPSLKPNRTSGSTRQYRQEDLEEIQRIMHLKTQGLTLSGTKKQLQDNRAEVEKTSEVVERLKIVKEELMNLTAEFDGLLAGRLDF